MKLTIAISAIVASTNSVHVNAFAASSTSKSVASAFVHHPTAGNVGRRKIKAWHKLELEPWCGLKMSATVDADAKLEKLSESEEKLMEAMAHDLGKENQSSFANDKDDPHARALRAETHRYLSSFLGSSGAAVVYSKLVEHGVKTVNGYSGGAVLPLLDQFHSEHPRHPEAAPIKWITNSNESSAGHVAEGMAKSSLEDADGKPAAGVVVATSGPGVTNLITPLQDAICDGVPMVVLCGQAATNAPEAAFQFAPAVGLTKPCTKWSYQIKSAVELPLVMDYAFYLAREGRPGPVFIDLPKDLQSQLITQDLIDAYVRDIAPNSEMDAGAEFPPLVRMQAHFDSATQQSDAALLVGEPQKSLPFTVGTDRIEAVPISSACKFDGVDAFRWDHAPSDRIFVNTFDQKASGQPDADGSTLGDSAAFREMMEMIQGAQRPVILAGNGANDAPQELLELAERLQIPVCTTLHALGCFDERHPLALNMVGMHGHPTPNFMVQECDLLINIGSRFDDRITGNPAAFLPQAKLAAQEGRGGVIHVDIRKSECGKQVEPQYFVHSTGKTFLQHVVAYLRAQDGHSAAQDDHSAAARTNTRPWLNRMKLLQAEFPVGIPRFRSETLTDDADPSKTFTRTRISAQHVIDLMNKQILAQGVMDNCLFTTGVGIHQMVAAQLLTWTQPRQMLSSGSLGTMGVALGYVIGAKLANAGKMCIAVDGDGSFNMTFTELKTVAEHKIPIKLIILDNECQMMVEYWQRLFFDGRYIAVHNPQNPEYTKLADSFGIKSLYCDCEEDLEEKMREFLFDDPDEPVLFHCRIERTPCLPLVAPGQALDNMILVDDQCQEVDRCVAPS